MEIFNRNMDNSKKTILSGLGHLMFNNKYVSR